VQDIKLTESLAMDGDKRVRRYEIDILYKNDYEKTVFSDYEISKDEFKGLMSSFEKDLRRQVAKQLHRKALDASIGITSVRREDLAAGIDEDEEGDEEGDEGNKKKKNEGKKKKGDQEDDSENVRKKRSDAKKYDEESESEEEEEDGDDLMMDEEEEEETKENKGEEDDDLMDDGDEERDTAGTKSSKKQVREKLTITITMPASDKVMMMQLVESCVESKVLHERKGIKRCFVSQAKPERPDQSKFVVQTEGVNFAAVMALATLIEQCPKRFPYLIDVDHVNSNDVHKMLHYYGVEAARCVLVREVGSVFKVYGINVDQRHLSLIGDYQMFDGNYRSFSRNGSGMSCNASPLLQISFETAGNFIINAATFNRSDNLSTPAASIITGLPVHTGTGAFFQAEQILDPELLHSADGDFENQIEFEDEDASAEMVKKEHQIPVKKEIKAESV